MALKVGDTAPEFSLYNSDKQLVNLSDYKGKNVVLLFFPLAFTGTCTKELCGVRDSLHNYTNLNAEVLAISVDALHTLNKWKEIEGFNFTMLSDFNKEVSKKYDSLYEEFSFGMKGVSKRSAFVIDKNGIIKYAEILENAGHIPDMEAIQQTLASLQN